MHNVFCARYEVADKASWQSHAVYSALWYHLPRRYPSDLKVYRVITSKEDKALMKALWVYGACRV